MIDQQRLKKVSDEYAGKVLSEITVDFEDTTNGTPSVILQPVD